MRVHVCLFIVCVCACVCTLYVWVSMHCIITVGHHDSIRGRLGAFRTFH